MAWWAMCGFGALLWLPHGAEACFDIDPFVVAVVTCFACSFFPFTSESGTFPIAENSVWL